MPALSAPGGADLPVALVFTDIEGSTRLWEQLGTRFREVTLLHDQCLRAALSEAGGYEVKVKSDSLMAAFADVDAALAFCVDAQRRLAAAAWPEVLREAMPEAPGLRGLRVRMGLHYGPALRVANPTSGRADYLGPTANRASRIASLAHGGQILLSGAAREALSGCALPLHSHGEHALRGLDTPEPIWEALPFPDRQLPPPEGRARPLTNLRPRPTSFLGREAELGALDALIEHGGRLVSLLGHGGAGKTRLASAYAMAKLDDFPGGAWFIDLSDAWTADGVLLGLARDLGLRLEEPDPAGSVGRAIAARGRALLVLDNLEQIVEPAAALIEQWLRAAPEAVFLVTSRIALGLAAERRLTLQSLPLPEPTRDLEALAANPAMALFLARARAVRPTFTLTAENAADLTGIVHAIEGLPLAIELAAARVGVLSTRVMLRRLDQQLDLLTGGRRDLPARQASLRAVLDGSWALLQPWEQAALAQLSAFRGGFSLEAAEGVVALDGEPGAPPALEVVQALLDHSLILTQGSGGEPRFGLTLAVRSYAAERLSERGDRAATERRHLDWVLTLNGRGRQTLSTELDNIVIATERATAAGLAGEAARAALVACEVIASSGPFRRAVNLCASVLALPGLGSADRLGVLNLLAFGLCRTGQLGRALALFDEAIGLAREVGDRMMEGRLLGNRTTALYLSGDLEGVIAGLPEVIRLFEAVGERRHQGVALLNLANALQDIGDFDAASDLYHQARALLADAGDEVNFALATGNLGILARRRGRLAEAEQRVKEAETCHSALGELIYCAFWRGLRGQIERSAGRLEAARGYFEDAVRLHLELGIPAGAARWRQELSEVARQQGALQEADQLLGLAMPVLRETRERLSLAEALVVRGNLCLDRREAEGAATALAEAEALAADAGARTSSELAQRVADLAARLGQLRRTGAP